jgi:hypothetical protein
VLAPLAFSCTFVLLPRVSSGKFLDMAMGAFWHGAASGALDMINLKTGVPKVTQ